MERHHCKVLSPPVSWLAAVKVIILTIFSPFIQAGRLSYVRQNWLRLSYLDQEETNTDVHQESSEEELLTAQKAENPGTIQLTLNCGIELISG